MRVVMLIRLAKSLEDIRKIARLIMARQAWDELPVLADALDDEGVHPELATRCRADLFGTRELARDEWRRFDFRSGLESWREYQERMRALDEYYITNRDWRILLDDLYRL